MSVVLILINGRAGVGKDTFINFCKDYVEKYYENTKVFNRHRSELAKIALKYLGWTGEKTEEIRKVLSELTDISESYGRNNEVLNDYIEFLIKKDSLNIVFYHNRDPVSIDLLKQRYKDDIFVFSLLLKRDTIDLEPDEWGIENYDYDITIKTMYAVEMKTYIEVRANFLNKNIHIKKCLNCEKEVAYSTRNNQKYCEKCVKEVRAKQRKESRKEQKSIA